MHETPGKLSNLHSCLNFGCHFLSLSRWWNLNWWLKTTPLRISFAFKNPENTSGAIQTCQLRQVIRVSGNVRDTTNENYASALWYHGGEFNSLEIPWKQCLFKTLGRQERKSRLHFRHILFPALFLLLSSSYSFSAIIIITRHLGNQIYT